MSNVSAIRSRRLGRVAHTRLARLVLGATLLTIGPVPSVCIAQPTTPDGPGFVPIFDGKTLNGWAGQDPSYWSVVDGAITGTITPQHAPTLNQYLVWLGGNLEDFELKLEFRLAGDHAQGANSGFQFRSRRLPNGDVGGYQVDNNRDTSWKARLYDEFGRHDLALMGERSVCAPDGKRTVEKLALEPSATDFQIENWHEYDLLAVGPKLTLRVNHKLIAETTDNDADSFDAIGILALQLHTGPPQQVQFRNIRLRRIGQPTPPSARAALVAEAALHWDLGHRLDSHQPPLKAQGTFTANLQSPGSTARFAHLDHAYFDLQTGLNQPRDWNAPVSALTVWLSARVPDGNWTSALFAKRGDHDHCNFNLFGVDFPDTPGPDIGFEIHTDQGFYMTSFPVSKIDATAWHDLVGRYDGKTLQLLCDGTVMAQVPATGALTPNAEPLLIGAETDHGTPGRFFTGDMAEAALWTRALTDGEIKTVLDIGRR